MAEGKVCTTCHEFKFFTDYHKNKTSAILVIILNVINVENQ